MTASETVRIGRLARRRLEELRARLSLETGRRFTLQEIVDAAILLAARMPEELMKELGLWKPLERGEAERLLAEYELDADVEDVEEDLRRVLYGEHTS